MVKADLTRDYYGDLELQPGASESDIKKQFRILALKYHPDRNPGREAEVNSKFQTIQSAHEVLTDPEQRTKYDSARLRNGAARTNGGSTPQSTTASGTRSNPWANAGSQWAPPPKPPPPRDFEKRKPPPPSAGAQRYANFTAANGTAPRPSQDAEARRKNYQAWESMRPQPQRPGQPPKAVPKEYTPQSGREESDNYKHPPPPRSSKPGYDEFRAGASSSHSDRTSPTRAARKSGFKPGTPGPDEGPASGASAYFTRATGKSSSSRKQTEPPGPPPRTKQPIDPLRQFREQAGAAFEPRLSTPYATHGGEKTNPFESINLNRSKTTRDPSIRPNSARAETFSTGLGGDRHRSASPPRTRHHRNLSPEPGISRADSEINLGASPKRTFSSASRMQQASPTKPHTRFMPVDPNISSDGDDSDSEKHQPAFGTRSRTFAKRRTTPATGRSRESRTPSGVREGSIGENDKLPRKSSLAGFQQRRRSAEELKGNELNNPKIDDDFNNRSSTNRNNGTKGNPSVYATPTRSYISSASSDKGVSPLPTAVEDCLIQLPQRFLSQTSSLKVAASSEAFATSSKTLHNFGAPMTNILLSGSLSGALNLTPPGFLTPFETTQRSVVEQLLECKSFKPRFNRHAHSGTYDLCSDKLCDKTLGPNSFELNDRLAKFNNLKFQPIPLVNISCKRSKFSEYECGCSVARSPFRKQRRCSASRTAPPEEAEIAFLLNPKLSNNANKLSASSFSFNVPEEAFTPPRPHKTSFSSSAENISTKFTAADWHGKFQAGDYFTTDGAGVHGHARTRSGSRTRTKSPVKSWTTRPSQAPPIPNIDPEILQQTTDSEPVSSPGGTKFTAEEWARTFKPQNFAPPLYPPAGTPARPPLRTARRSRTSSSAPRNPNTTKTAGTAAMVNEDESSESPLEMGSRASHSAGAQRASPDVPATGVDSPNAMDIDPPLEQQPFTPTTRQNNSTASKDSANEVRNVPVEPSRPEWRAGDAGGSNVPPGTQTHPDLPPRPGNTGDRRRTTKSADEEDFKTNFEDLKNVEPMRHPATGLHSFNDLTSTLPFPSRAASTLTIPRNLSSGELDLPNPPRAPVVPNVVNAARPSMSSWETYLVDFKTYMAEWDIFNTRMVMHFVARKNQVDVMRPGWLEAFGDHDLDRYKEGLIEDMKVRQHWDVACDKHQAAIDKFQFFKGCLREGPPGTRRDANAAS